MESAHELIRETRSQLAVAREHAVAGPTGSGAEFLPGPVVFSDALASTLPQTSVTLVGQIVMESGEPARVYTSSTAWPAAEDLDLISVSVTKVSGAQLWTRTETVLLVRPGADPDPAP